MEISLHNLERKTCVEHPDAQRQSLKYIAKEKDSPTMVFSLYNKYVLYWLSCSSNPSLLFFEKKLEILEYL